MSEVVKIASRRGVEAATIARGTGGRGAGGRGAGERGAGGTGAGSPAARAKRPANANAAGSTGDAGESALNLAVVRGPCSGPPEVRVLESGTRMASLAVRCPADDAAGRATSVPVTVWDPAAWVETLEAGDEVVVVGRVRRRFYSRPGGVGSRVDIDAVAVARARDRRRVEALARRAGDALERLFDGG